MKKININKVLSETLQSQFLAFKDKFGRDPKPGEPIFFDPDEDEPQFMSAEQIAEIESEICEIMQMAKLPPAIIYAYKKTGRILTKENQKYATRADLNEWTDAINEYYAGI